MKDTLIEELDFFSKSPDFAIATAIAIAITITIAIAIANAACVTLRVSSTCITHADVETAKANSKHFKNDRSRELVHTSLCNFKGIIIMIRSPSINWKRILHSK